MHGAISGSGGSNALLIRSCSTPREAACDAEEVKISGISHRENEVAFLFIADEGITRKRDLQFRHFKIDSYSAYGPQAMKTVD